MDNSGCAMLDGREVERLLRIELQEVAANLGPPGLIAEVGCDATDLVLVIEDPLTEKRITRSVPAPQRNEGDDRPSGTGPGGRLGIERVGFERIVALALAQLFFVSWSELLMERDALAPRRPAAEEGDAAAALSADHVGVTGGTVALGLSGGARIRQVSTPLTTGRIELCLAPSDGTIGPRLVAAFEAGSTSRNVGDVLLRAGFLGAGLGGSLLDRRLFGIAVAGVISGGYETLTGEASMSSHKGATSSGLALEAAAAIGPWLALGPVTLGLELEAGLGAPTVEGRVANGVTVRPQALFVGARLGLTIVFGPRDRS